MHAQRLLNYVEIFAAPGGLSLGFMLGGFTPLLGVDTDKDGLETYSSNFPNTKVLQKDVRSLEGKDILNEIGLSRGEIDVMGRSSMSGFFECWTS